MKKTFLSLLLGAFIMTGLSANPSRASGTVAVVYFSATGTTERIAKNAAQAMGADLFEIEPVHKYTDAALFSLNQYQTRMKLRLQQVHTS